MYEEGNKHLSFNWGILAIKLIILAAIVFLAAWIFVRVSNSNGKSSSTLASTDSDYITNIASMKTAAFEYFTPSKLPEKVGGSEKLTLSQMINQKLLIDFTDDGKKCDNDASYIQATKTADDNYALKVSLTCGNKSDFIVTTIENSSTNNNVTSTDVEVDTTLNTSTNTSSTNNTTNKNNTTTSSSNSSSNSTSTNTSTNTSKPSSSTTTTNGNSTTTTTTNSSSTTTVKTTVTIKFTCNSIGCCNSSVCCNSSSSNSGNNKIYYSVTYDSNGGKGVLGQNVVSGSVATKPENPTKTGYTFVEWQLDGVTYDFNTPVTKNIVLKAVWQKNDSTIRYYKLVKYSDWEDGYSSENCAENKKTTVTTYNYCKITEKTYYTTSYVKESSKANTYTYELQLLDLDSNKIVQSSIGVDSSSKSYFSNSYTDYTAYQKQQAQQAIYITGNAGASNSDTSNVSTFKASSLNSSNFTFNVSGIRLVDGIYRTTITVNYKNHNGVTPYTSSNQLVTEPIFFVPLKFNVSFAYSSDCVRDTASNKSKYTNYSVSDAEVSTIWQHRIPTYRWSLTKTLSGYTYTGEYEDR
jgi:uncharacterized repeat protein (TIGR02543 family)